MNGTLFYVKANRLLDAAQFDTGKPPSDEREKRKENDYPSVRLGGKFGTIRMKKVCCIFLQQTFL